MSDARISNRDFAISIGLMLSAAVALSLVTLFAKKLTDLTGLHAAALMAWRKKPVPHHETPVDQAA